MEHLLLVVVLGVVCFGGMALYARRKARTDAIDPKVLSRTRMTGDGGGIHDDERWPFGKK
ncbi:MAG: hypothetical protein HKP54_14155 [Boseongicola sp.]|nr:hypothetical protein [Boseongicola sp.]